MDRIQVDFRQFDAAHVANLRKDTVRSPGAQPQTGISGSLLRSAVSAGASVSQALKMANEVLNISIRRPRVDWLPSPKAVAAAGSASDVTLALGFVGSAAYVVGPRGGGGIYGSTSGEIGFYGTFGGTLFGNAATSVRGAFSVMRATRPVFRRICLCRRD